MPKFHIIEFLSINHQYTLVIRFFMYVNLIYVDMELAEEQASSKQARIVPKCKFALNLHFLFKVKPGQPISKLNCIMCIMLLSMKCVMRNHSLEDALAHDH